MKFRITFCVGLALALTSVTAPPVVAAETAGADITQIANGYTYFNKTGSDLGSHNFDVQSCMRAVNLVRSFDEARGGDKDIVGAIMWYGSKVGSRAAALENCMVVRGWRVVMLPPAEGAALAGLSTDELTGRLEAEIGAERPNGTIARVWANDAADAATTRFNASPKFPSELMLSYRVATQEPKFIPGSLSSPDWTGRPIDPKWLPKKPLTPATLSLAPAGSAIILARIQGATLRNGITIVFQRVGPEIDTLASVADGDLDTFTVRPFGFGQKDLKDRFMIFALPPGRWRLASINRAFMPLNFCLGSPSFNVGADDVLNLGTFDLSARNITPDVSLGSPRTFLAGLPQAGQLRAATYTNGSLGVCGGATIYALEFWNAPFEPGYRWGSAVNPQAAALGVADH